LRYKDNFIDKDLTKLEAVRLRAAL